MGTKTSANSLPWASFYHAVLPINAHNSRADRVDNQYGWVVWASLGGYLYLDHASVRTAIGNTGYDCRYQVVRIPTNDGPPLWKLLS